MANETATLKPEFELAASVRVLMDNIDFESGACRLSDIVGACIPAGVLKRVRNALKEVGDPFSLEEQDNPTTEMVPFKEYAMKFGEDLGLGDVIPKGASVNIPKILTNSLITDKFNRDVPSVGKVISAKIDDVGIEVEGNIRADLKKKGRPSVAGRMLEKVGNKILKFELFEIGWVKKPKGE